MRPDPERGDGLRDRWEERLLWAAKPYQGARGCVGCVLMFLRTMISHSGMACAKEDATCERAAAWEE